MFSLYGISIFKNKFGYCEIENNFLINRDECLKSNKKWINFKFNFDNIGNALFTLLIITTFDGWKPILYVAVNSNTPDKVNL